MLMHLLIYFNLILVVPPGNFKVAKTSMKVQTKPLNFVSLQDLPLMQLFYVVCIIIIIIIIINIIRFIL